VSFDIFININILILLIFLECWKHNPGDRPDMEKVFSELELIYLDYLDCNVIIINELLLLHYNFVLKRMDEKTYIQLTKQFIVSKNKNEKEIFSYLLEEKDKLQNVLLLAIFFHYGIGNNRNKSKALELYKEAAKIGNISAASDLGAYYMNKIIANLENNEEPIIFIPFNNDENQCYCCRRIYSQTSLFKQKYCKNCLYLCIEFITSGLDIKHTINNLDICINSTDIICNKHKPRNLDFCNQEWCEDCLEILYFKQIVTNNKFDFDILDHFYEKNCKLCGKLIYGQNDDITKLRLCPDCYLITFEFVESPLIKKRVLILHLPWWDACSQCIICDKLLESKSHCQKWCPYCFIVYTGCKYCLTTNIIFGITKQTQCVKCKKMSLITIEMSYMMAILFLKFNALNYNQIANYINKIVKNYNPLEIYNFIKMLNYLNLLNISSQITNKENNEDYLNTTIPITFIPFNNNEDQCYCCKKIYSKTFLFKQKYCKNCLYLCIEFITSGLDIKHTINNLDICINSTDIICNKHKPRNLDFCNQEWCENCSVILYFKQVVTNRKLNFNYIDKKICRLCGNKQNSDITEFRLCSYCYLISFVSTESTLIINLPWWDACSQCMICDQLMELKSYCQKWCLNCSITYIGCRYCLMTNIIFGFINQSKCKNCKRVIAIINTTNISGNYNIDQFLYFTKINFNSINKFVNYINNNISKNFNPLMIYNLAKKFDFSSKLKIEWIPYSQITNLEKIGEGGYGNIYKASISGNIVAVKNFLNSRNPSKYFLNEVIF
jgi:hypothetical protein